MDAQLPTERRFWFDPSFHPGQSVLLHKQADGMWRIDFQLGWDADPVEERKPENITPRVRALLDSIGFADVQFQIGWASVYTFACQRMERFRHGRVLFAGDSAHGVSPFGARGANSGVQDADNLAWKLAAVVQGTAPDALLDSYASEREYAADENIRNSTRATDFITPKSEVSRLFRDAVLALTKRHAFARTLVNSGRLSVATVLRDSPLNTARCRRLRGRDGAGRRGGRCARGARRRQHRLAAARMPRRAVHRAGVRQQGDAAERSLQALKASDAPLHIVRVQGTAAEGELAAQRYDAQPGTVYLLRPDQHVCARWRQPTAANIRAAIDRALAKA
jgi:3-(3-hydroxy-phenyl)propionate hydroxylase